MNRSVKIALCASLLLYVSSTWCSWFKWIPDFFHIGVFEESQQFSKPVNSSASCLPPSSLRTCVSEVKSCDTSSSSFSSKILVTCAVAATAAGLYLWRYVKNCRKKKAERENLAKQTANQHAEDNQLSLSQRLEKRDQAVARIRQNSRAHSPIADAYDQVTDVRPDVLPMACDHCKEKDREIAVLKSQVANMSGMDSEDNEILRVASAVSAQNKKIMQPGRTASPNTAIILSVPASPVHVESSDSGPTLDQGAFDHEQQLCDTSTSTT